MGDPRVHSDLDWNHELIRQCSLAMARTASGRLKVLYAWYQSLWPWQLIQKWSVSVRIDQVERIYQMHMDVVKEMLELAETTQHETQLTDKKEK